MKKKNVNVSNVAVTKMFCDENILCKDLIIGQQKNLPPILLIVHRNSNQMFLFLYTSAERQKYVEENKKVPMYQ